MIAGNQLWIWCIMTNTGHERYHKNVLILNQIRVMILKLLLNNNSVPDYEDGNPGDQLKILNLERVAYGDWVSAL